MINACTLVRTYGPLVARILLAQLFIVSGIGKAMLLPKQPRI